MEYFSFTSMPLLGALGGSVAWSLYRKHTSPLLIASRLAESAVVGFVFDYILRMIPFTADLYTRNGYVSGAIIGGLVFFAFWNNPMMRKVIDKADAYESSLLMGIFGDK